MKESDKSQEVQMPRDYLTMPASHDELYPKQHNYQLSMKIAFQATGRNLNPTTVSPVLEKFKQKLINFHFNEGTLKAFPSTVDELHFEEFQDHVLFSYNIM